MLWNKFPIYPLCVITVRVAENMGSTTIVFIITEIIPRRHNHHHCYLCHHGVCVCVCVCV